MIQMKVGVGGGWCCESNSLLANRMVAFGMILIRGLEWRDCFLVIGQNASCHLVEEAVVLRLHVSMVGRMWMCF